MAEVVKTYELLQQLLAHTPDVVFFKDRSSRYVEFNDAFRQLTGVPRGLLMGHDARVFLPRDVAETVLREDAELMRSGQPLRRENWVEYPDGRMALMDTILAPIKDESGEVMGLLGIGRDVTGFMNAAAELREQNDALTKSNRELDTLIYHVAHDLRSPLSSLQGLIELMRAEKDPEQLQRYIDLQEKTIHKLDQFIQEVMHLNQNRFKELDVQEVDLEGIYWNIVDQCRYLPGSANIDFQVTIEGDHALCADACRLSMVLTNLISNGIRYHDPSKPKPFLHLRAHIGPKVATLLLQDNGIGIAEEHLDHIFEMFYRASTRGKGSGIGLYIVKETLSRIGGSIQVSSRVGEGTTFKVEIPNHPPGGN